jgi:WD40 repeat protein
MEVSTGGFFTISQKVPINVIMRQYIVFKGLQQINVLKYFSDDEGLMQRMNKYRVAKVHQGCVNSICWNERGTCILSGSDDQHIKITDPFAFEPKVRELAFLDGIGGIIM